MEFLLGNKIMGKHTEVEIVSTLFLCERKKTPRMGRCVASTQVSCFRLLQPHAYNVKESPSVPFSPSDPPSTSCSPSTSLPSWAARRLIGTCTQACWFIKKKKYWAGRASQNGRKTAFQFHTFLYTKFNAEFIFKVFQQLKKGSSKI